MSVASDPKQVLARIIDTHQEAERGSAGSQPPEADSPLG
jgi:hypothetical protein